MAKKIRFFSETIKTVRGVFTYLIIPDRNSGRKNVFTVLVKNVSDPVTIGRELPIADARQLIVDFENVPKNFVNFGDRGGVVARLNRVLNKRWDK